MWSCTLLAYLKCFLSDSASKHATQAYFDCLRAEVDRFGLQVSVISPGYIRTNLSINAVTGDGSKYGGESMLFLSTIWVIKDVLENEYHKYTNCNIIHMFFFVCVCSFGSEVMDKTTARGSDPVDVARAVLKAVCHKQKDVVLAGLLPAAAVYLRTLWPALYFRLMASRAIKEHRVKEE